MGYTANRVLNLFKKHGTAAYIGEPVSQLEHAAQCALLAREAGADEEVIIAAFLHDIGHLAEMDGLIPHAEKMEELGLMDHDMLGAAMLADWGFSQRVCKLVGSHVDAKRYLTFKNAAYYQRLSEASKQTLKLQGGPMVAAEARAFEQDVYFEDYIRLRQWDEAAKQPNKVVDAEQLNQLEQLIHKHINRQHATCY